MNGPTAWVGDDVRNGTICSPCQWGSDQGSGAAGLSGWSWLCRSGYADKGLGLSPFFWWVCRRRALLPWQVPVMTVTMLREVKFS